MFVSQWFNCHLRGCGVLISPFNSLMCVCVGGGEGAWWAGFLTTTRILTLLFRFSPIEFAFVSPPSVKKKQLARSV